MQMIVLRLVETAATLNESNPAANVYLRELCSALQSLRSENKLIQKKAKSIRSSLMYTYTI